MRSRTRSRTPPFPQINILPPSSPPRALLWKSPIVQPPTPGPNDLLIEVKSIALNPVDYHQRDHGVYITSYPVVLGSDVAGIIISAGSSVPSDAPKPGTRVTAFTPGFFAGDPDYGALQTRVLVPATNVTPLPQGMSFNEAGILPWRF